MKKRVIAVTVLVWEACLSGNIHFGMQKILPPKTAHGLKWVGRVSGMENISQWKIPPLKACKGCVISTIW